MGMLSAMTTAISGLEANGQALSIVSDNIVNANTNGFKSSRGEFQNFLAQDLMQSGGELGHGVQMGGVTTLFSQGTITRTDRGTDVAVNGSGFFVLKGDAKGMTYTRDGSFRFDKEGWLSTLGGQKVQAYLATNENKISGKLGDVKIPFNSIPAQPTKDIKINVNLDARTQVGGEFDINRAGETSQFTSSIQIFDSIGNAHPVDVFFVKRSDSSWEWSAVTDGANLAGGTKGQAGLIASGALTFDQEGKLIDQQQNIVNTSFANGAIPDQKLSFDFGVAQAGDSTQMGGTTQFGTKSSTFRNTQDGSAAGYLSETLIDQEGVITGVYSNGHNRLLGQIALARFDASERLSKVGENQFRETTNSGQAFIGKANTSGRGSLMVKALEASNVDVAREFVEMIRAQRGFQASAKSITTANEMLDEVINLRRA